MKNIILMIFGFVLLAGCSNTLDGAGRDIEKAGQKVQQTF